VHAVSRNRLADKANAEGEANLPDLRNNAAAAI
jgi:hypothetical protein